MKPKDDEMTRTDWAGIVVALVLGLLLAVFTYPASAADTKGSALTALEAAPAATDTLYIIDDTTSKKITVDYLLGILEATIASYEIHSDNLPAGVVTQAPTNVTPVDTGDENASFYLLMVDDATGTQATETDGEGARYNPSTGVCPLSA